MCQGPASAEARDTLRMNSISERDESKGERKRLIFLCLHRKPIYPLTRDLLCSQRPQVPSRWGLRSSDRKVNSESLCAPGDQSEKKRRRESEWERERKKDTGRPSLGGTGLQFYFQKELLYSELHIYRSERCRVMQSQLNIPSVLTFIETRIFFTYLSTYKGLLLCTLSSGPMAC